MRPPPFGGKLRVLGVIDVSGEHLSILRPHVVVRTTL
jgi:hypothetical protein